MADQAPAFAAKHALEVGEVEAALGSPGPRRRGGAAAALWPTRRQPSRRSTPSRSGRWRRRSGLPDLEGAAARRRPYGRPGASLRGEARPRGRGGGGGARVSRTSKARRRGGGPMADQAPAFAAKHALEVGEVEA